MEISPSLLTYTLLTTYSLCGCLMEHFTLFYAWTLTTSNTDLQCIQYTTGIRTALIYVFPKAILSISTLALLSQEPLLWISLALWIVNWTSSFMVQIPLQLKVKRSADRVALGRLYRTTWVRTVTLVGHCGVVVYIVFWTK